MWIERAKTFKKTTKEATGLELVPKQRPTHVEPAWALVRGAVVDQNTQTPTSVPFTLQYPLNMLINPCRIQAVLSSLGIPLAWKWVLPPSCFLDGELL